jgi:hypothetical protein
MGRLQWGQIRFHYAFEIVFRTKDAPTKNLVVHNNSLYDRMR